jgi:hypothetical protein
MVRVCVRRFELKGPGGCETGNVVYVDLLGRGVSQSLRS